MAVFDRIHPNVIKQEFEYYGLFMGLVPVYVGDPQGECRVAVRNWWPEWLLDLAQASLTLLSWAGLVRPGMIMIQLTGRIDGARME